MFENPTHNKTVGGDHQIQIKDLREMEFLLITLLIFSGRPNPECRINIDDPSFQNIKAALPVPPGTPIFGGLGYSGFNVKDVTDARTTYIEIPRRSDLDLEHLLFNACRFDENLRKYVFIPVI
ncbi:hypothetical protein AM593_01734, partial [Mytilus galloprovincialis]